MKEPKFKPAHIIKNIEKYVDRYFEQKAFPKYLSGIKNLIRVNHKEGVKSFSNQTEEDWFNIGIGLPSPMEKVWLKKTLFMST